MLESLRTPLTVLGRVMLALMFLMSGPDKLMHAEATAGFMASGGLPAMPLLAMAVGLFELLGGLSVATGFLARWSALALALFTLAASVMFHHFWSVPAEAQAIQQLLFMKNIAVAGGLFLVAAMGPGPGSLGRPD